MSELDDATELMKRCARACVAHGEDVVIVGRLALLLYRQHPTMTGRPGLPLATREVDAAVPRTLPVVDDKSVAERLKLEGLVAYDIPGLSRTSVGKRVFQDQREGNERLARSYLEFVAPKRNDDEGLIQPQPALTASALRYVELLLFRPLVVDVDGLPVHVAAPSMFIAQKLLMRDSASGRREDKDLVSIYDAAVCLQGRLDDEAAVVDAACGHAEVWRKWLQRVPKLGAALFATGATDGAVVVSTSLRKLLSKGEVAPSPEAVAKLVTTTLDRLFARATKTA